MPTYAFHADLTKGNTLLLSSYITETGLLVVEGEFALAACRGRDHPRSY